MLSGRHLLQDMPALAAALPPFPRVVLQLLDLLRDDDLSLDTLARLVRNDPVIAGQILAAANHVRRLRLQSDLSDPFAAASLIGLNRVRGIVVNAGMNRFLQQAGGTPFFYAHSLAVAIIAQELALLLDLPFEEAYIAGILHDIGQLCFHVADPEAYRRVTEQAAQDGRLIEHEQACFACNHSQIGHRLAEFWNLPAGVLQAIATHHDEGAPESRLQAAIMIAEVLSRALDLPASPNNHVLRLNTQACTLLGIDFATPAMQDCLGRSRARYRRALPAG